MFSATRAQRWPAALAVTAGLLLIAYSHLRYGLTAQSSLQVSHMIPVLFAGLMLGRRAVWAAAVAVEISLLVGVLSDLQQGLDPNATWSTFLQPSLGCLLLAIVLDRMIVRSDDAARHCRELDLLCDDLESEINERKAKQAELVHSKKMEVLAQFASGVAHDFNNLLNVIQGYAKDPLASVSMNSAQESLEGVTRAAERGVGVVRRLQHLTRMQGPASVFDLGPAVQLICPLFESLFGRSVTITCQVPEQPVLVCMDRDELELALLNIAKNSHEAMPEGGHFFLKVIQLGNEAIIEASDTGHGIPESLRGKIFEPFFSTKTAQGRHNGSGTGIGLATVYKSIIAANGSITAANNVDGGATLRIVLPIAS